MERVPTGIYGLDELLGGGFLRGRNILVSGATGTGKTIFGIQYLVNGALQEGEPGVYVAFDEQPEKIRQEMLNFGWNLAELERKGMFKFVDASITRLGLLSEEKEAIEPGEIDFDAIVKQMLKAAVANDARRAVIDSIPALALHLKDESEIRLAVFKLAVMAARSKLTTIMTSEVPEQSLAAGQPMQFSKYGVEEYVADGVILLNYLGVGTQAARTMYIRKMRGTQHSEDIHPLEITKRGIVVKKVEELVSE